MRWIASTAGSGRVVLAVVWVPVVAKGDSATARSLQSLQCVALRDSAAIAMRWDAVHHVPGSASRDHAWIWACVSSGRIDSVIPLF